MGSSTDFESEGLRRLIVNAVYWGLGMEDRIPEQSDVRLVGEYKPTSFGFGSNAVGCHAVGSRVAVGACPTRYL